MALNRACLLASLVALWVVWPDPALSRGLYGPHYSYSYGYGYGYGYRPYNQCQQRERRYVNSYRCLSNTERRFCWLLERQLESLGCQEPCYKYQGQGCVGSSDSCSTISGLCPNGQKCCNV